MPSCCVKESSGLFHTKKDYKKLIILAEERTREKFSKVVETPKEIEHRITGDWLLTTYPDGRKRWERITNGNFES